MAGLLAASSLLAACGDATPTPGTGTGTTPAGTTPAAAGRAVVVSSKNFTEEVILGEMYAQLLENAGIPVTRKLNLGTTDVAQAALVKGGDQSGIDLYPEYTSTGLLSVLKADPIDDPAAVYAAVKDGYEKQFKLTWLAYAPMNDTQALVTTKDVADKQGIKTLDDLCTKGKDLTIAAVAEFKDRVDALPRLQKLYGGCALSNIKVFEPNLRYQALLKGDVQVAQAFSTDGEIAGNGLVLLADPKNYGLAYNVAPVVRDDVLAMYPKIADALNAVAPKITNAEISALNWEVAGKHRTEAEVAKEWLQKQGLIK
jgi:osmoprotectant transport system substrate-binding protein